MELLAFGEPLEASVLPEAVLERLEARRLVDVDDRSAARLVHPLHGPVLRARAGRLRADRLRRTDRDLAAALAFECGELLERSMSGDVREIPVGVGERLAEEDAGWGEPAMPEFCACRARLARLRGEIRDALSWSREGLRRHEGHPACLAELAHAAAYLGDLETARRALTGLSAPSPARTWLLAAEANIDGALRSLTEDSVLAPHDTFDSRGVFVPHDAFVPHEVPTPHDAFASHGVFVPHDAFAPHEVPTPHDAFASHDVAAPHDVFALHDAVRLGAPALVAERLGREPGDLASLLTTHATALISRDGQSLDRVANRLEQRGLLLHAAEASAQAAMIHRDHRAARTSRNRASTLARRCQGARTPVLVDATLGELTPRQRQIVGLAATGLTNRQIAEQLTLSIRTVANHLYGAYERLGSGDRAGLGSLF
ncbi:hypothetical protein DKM19_05795 [Streptosporangium sp. 'caverna']|nr:hypothetical protein DKM19_05795 [Streptosporangium sp. 'caverna']